MTTDTTHSGRRQLPTRRSILKAAAAGAMLFPSSQFSGAAVAPSDRKFKITLSPGMLGIKANLRECVNLAAKYGFEGVEPITSDLAQLSPD